MNSIQEIDVSDSLIDDKLPEIYMIGDDEIEMESENLFADEWCQNEKTESIQDTWVNALSVELESIAAVDPRPIGCSRPREPGKKVYNSSTKKWSLVEEGFSPDSKINSLREEVPDSLPALSALDWQDSHLGVDFRPHLYEPSLKRHLLVDSGSQVCAMPPEPGDKPLKGVFLKAANGTKIVCYGRKKFSIKIGRKSYDFMAYKAEIDSPILGWDFVRHHKLDLIWDEDGNQCIYDKKAKITKVLDFKPVDHHKSSGLKNLSVIECNKPRKRSPEQSMELAFQVAAVKSLMAEEKEDLTSVPDSESKGERCTLR